jgi:hypothetical protein
MYSLEYNHIQHQINSINENMKELSQKDYLSTLDNVIYNWAIDNHREPKHIIVHPNTWQYIGSQMGINPSMFLHDFTTNNKYRGYKVIRSFDVDEDKFEIG